MLQQRWRRQQGWASSATQNNRKSMLKACWGLICVESIHLTATEAAADFRHIVIVHVELYLSEILRSRSNKKAKYTSGGGCGNLVVGENEKTGRGGAKKRLFTGKKQSEQSVMNATQKTLNCAVEDANKDFHHRGRAEKQSEKALGVIERHIHAGRSVGRLRLII
eukprot:5436527-Pleurochrysis_carterae.AAC.3